MKLLIAIFAVWVAVIAALPYALATDDSNERVKIELHKLSIDEYEQSEQHKVTKAASESLKRIKAGDL